MPGMMRACKHTEEQISHRILEIRQAVLRQRLAPFPKTENGYEEG
jgi:hypothetical protein